MLKRTPGLPQAVEQTNSDAVGGLDFRAFLGLARRHLFLIAAISSGVIGVCVVYLLVAQPVYLSKAYLLLDTRRMQVFQQQALVQDASFDAPAVESQMEIIRSETIAASVVDELQLYNDPEMTGVQHGALRWLSLVIRRVVGSQVGNRLLGAPLTSQEARTAAALSYLRANLQVQRVRTTYVIEIGFRSEDAAKAARIANAVGDAYILDQTQSKQYTTRRATNWLQERMVELREQAVAAERAVQDFRTKNNLLKVGEGTELQLQELNTQYARAREATAETKARLDRLSEIMGSRVPDASMTAWLQNDVINRLRQQYVDTSRREADYVVRLGPEHQAVMTARKELRQIERAAKEELRRIYDSWKGEYEIAQSREKIAEARLNEGTQQNAGSRQEQGTLQVLESAARTYQSLHDTFLQRFLEATQQQNFTASEARMITAAGAGVKVQPHSQQVLILGAAAGLALGCGAAYLRERVNRVFRTAKDLEQTLGVECFGILPALDNSRPPSPEITSEAAVDRIISQDLGIARQVILTPFSRFTETIRGIKVAADTSNVELKVIGFVSAVPAEGKSTVAVNFAQLVAHGGSRTLLIDADLRQPALTRQLTPLASAGLLEVLEARCSLQEAVWKDPVTGLDFLPAVLEAPIAHTSEILSSRTMAGLVSQARDRYDYVVVDFPPLAPVVDAKASSHLVDGFILVVEWGQTSPEIVLEALGSAEVVQSKIVGAVLNRADPGLLRRIELYKGKNYHRYYASYGGG